jgi:hypothetical protein
VHEILVQLSTLYKCEPASRAKADVLARLRERSAAPAVVFESFGFGATSTVAAMTTSETAILYEVGAEPEPGSLRLTRLCLEYTPSAVSLSFSTLKDACDFARGKGWSLAPIPDNDEDFRPGGCRDLTPEAWATVRRLMVA